jgi:hypothetical protein
VAVFVVGVVVLCRAASFRFSCFRSGFFLVRFYFLLWSFSFLFFGHHHLPHGGGRWFWVVFVFFAGALLFTGMLCICFVFWQKLCVCFVCATILFLVFVVLCVLFVFLWKSCHLPPGGSGSGGGAWK